MLEERRLELLFKKEEKKKVHFFMDPSFQNFDKWQKVNAQIVETLIHFAISSIAKKQNVIIAHNPINTFALGHFLRSDVQSKTMLINTRSEKTGFIRGFLDVHSLPEFLCPKPLYFDVGKRFFLQAHSEKGISLCLEETLSNPLYVAAYPDGKFVVSDIDALLIASTKNAISTPIKCTSFGEATSLEVNILEEINRLFQEIVERYFPSLKPYTFRLFTHGPASRFSQSKQSHLHFPMTIYFNDGKIESFGSEGNREESIHTFVETCKTWECSGYEVELNPLWGLSQCV